MSEVRAFLGALVDSGITKGFFASTSPVTAPARDLAKRTDSKPYRIELFDGPRFIKALRLKQKPVYISFNHWQDTIGNVEYAYMESEGPTYLP